MLPPSDPDGVLPEEVSPPASDPWLPDPESDPVVLSDPSMPDPESVLPTTPASDPVLL